MPVLTVNGKTREFPGGVPANLSALVRELAVTDAAVVAELDGAVVRQEHFAETPLREGQIVELIRFVGGG